MISYLIKSGLCLAILLAFYYLVLEREKMHQFNRFYLLGSILFSFIAPLMIIYVEATPEVIFPIEETGIAENNERFLANEQGIITSNSFDYSFYLLSLYIAISSLLFVRFLVNFVGIVQKIRSNIVLEFEKAKLVLVQDKILPHTFWNYIFINQDDYELKKVETELFTHELTHVTQRHTIDVLIVELLHIALWFNPFFYPLKKAIQLNHEFLADDNVIASHQDIPKYQYLLLDKATWKNKYYLASNLNYSLTKKRLLMMKTQNSKSTILLKKLAIVPLLGGLVFLFADRVEAQTTKKTPEVIEVQSIENGATDAQMKEYAILLQESEKKKMYKQQEVVRMRYIHSLMSEKQQKSVQDINEILPPLPPPAKSMNRKISSKKYEELKDKKKFAVWIDGKVIDNKELNQYKASDFVSHFGSFVHKNARSKKFPQEYQYSLYTQSHVDKLQREYEIEQKRIPPPIPMKIKVVEVEDKLPPPPPRKSNHVSKPYPISKATYEKIKNAKKYVVWIDGKKVDNKVLDKYSASDFTSHVIVKPVSTSKNTSSKTHYKLMTKEYYEKYQKKYKEVPPPPKPVKIEVVQASKALMDEYKKFAAFFTSEKKNKVIKEKDYKRIQEIYKSMSPAQKKSVKHYREYIPPPPPRKIKEVKVKKAPKKKIKIKETLSPKGDLEIKEEIEEIEEREEEIEIREKIEIKEVPEGVEEEEIEIREVPHTEEEEEVEIHRERKHKEAKHKEHKYEEKHKGRKHAEHFKEDYKSLVKEGAKFYLNGKKVSAKKIKKYFFEKKDDVQTIDVVKMKNKVPKVKLKTK